MATNKPRQKRSRERVEKIMLAAADELARTADADALTTTSVSKRSGIPVATIYRYFADRSAIISALIDQEMREIDAALAAKLEGVEPLTFGNLLDTMMQSHYEHFRSTRRSIVLWFGARSSKEVLGRVNRRYRYMGDWLMDGALNSGMAVPEAPKWGGEAIVWLCDRTFEYMFREQRSREEEEAILAVTLSMLKKMLEDYETDRARDGITSAEFLEFYGRYEPPSGPLD